MAELMAKFDEQSLVGKKIGSYELLELVAHGGMGYVYRGRDLSLAREVAIKILKPELAEDKEFEQRFVREARTVAQLDHAHIVPVYAAGKQDGILFIVMPFVRGKTLQEAIRERGAFPVDEAVRITRQIASALAFAHQQDLIHRDVKPSNIILDRHGNAKIMDFGLAKSVSRVSKLTQDGVFYGTPEYSSPEQCETSALDARTDVFSLGVVLYEMLTGRVPFTAETPLALFKKITGESPIPVRSLRPEVPRLVEELVNRMMAKDRDVRLQSCAEVVREIDALGTGGGSRKPLLAVGAVVVTALVVLAAVMFRPSRPQQTPGGAVAGGGGSDSKPAPVVPAKKQEMKVLVLDPRNSTGKQEYEWYRVMIGDNLTSQLSQLPCFKIPTRDEVLVELWKNDATGEAIDARHRDALIKLFDPELVLMGSYTVVQGTLRLSIDCYHAHGGRVEKMFTRVVARREEQFFELVDEMTAAIVAGVQENKTNVLAGGHAPPGKAEANWMRSYSVENQEMLAKAQERELKRKLDEIPDTKAPAASKEEPAAEKTAIARLRRGADKGMGAREQARWYYQNKVACEQVKDKKVYDRLTDMLRRGMADAAEFEAMQKDCAEWNLKFSCIEHPSAKCEGGRCEECGRAPTITVGNRQAEHNKAGKEK